MKEYTQLKHRAKGTAAQRKKPQVLKAAAANEIYSWDITYLLSPIKGQYYYLVLARISHFLKNTTLFLWSIF